jgi:hypothetical protein
MLHKIVGNKNCNENKAEKIQLHIEIDVTTISGYLPHADYLFAI